MGQVHDQVQCSAPGRAPQASVDTVRATTRIERGGEVDKHSAKHREELEYSEQVEDCNGEPSELHALRVAYLVAVVRV